MFISSLVNESNYIHLIQVIALWCNGMLYNPVCTRLVSCWLWFSWFWNWKSRSYSTSRKVRITVICSHVICLQILIAVRRQSGNKAFFQNGNTLRILIVKLQQGVRVFRVGISGQSQNFADSRWMGYSSLWNVGFKNDMHMHIVFFFFRPNASPSKEKLEHLSGLAIFSVLGEAD